MKSKILMALLLTTLSQTSFADNGHERFRFVTGETEKNINLDYEVTKTYFRTDYVSAICSRTVMGPGNSFHSQYYTCIQPQTVAYQVHDYNIFANVNFQFEATEGNAMIVAQFDVKLKATDLSVTVSKVKNMVVTGSAIKKITTDRNNNKIVEANYQIKFFEMGPIFSPVTSGIKNLAMTDNYLTFVIGKMVRSEFNVINLEVKKTKFFKDKTLFNKVLRLDELEIEEIDEKSSLIKIDIAKLSVQFEKDDKYVFVVTSKVAMPYEILNSDELPKMETSEKIKIKMK